MNQEKTAAFEQGKMLIHQDYAPTHKSVIEMAKVNESKSELLLHAFFSPYWTAFG